MAFFLYHEPKKDEPVQDPEVKQEQSQETYISIDDLVKVHLAVGTITECEEVLKSDRLYKLQIDFGDLGKRQILAGIKQAYAQEELMNKQVVCVINLKLRAMLGLESQGMVLAAQDSSGKPQIISSLVQVPNGTRLK